MKSMAYNPAAGLGGMLKSGSRSLEGVQASTLRNIDAAKQLSTIASTSLGPNGMNKLVINHLGKIILTSDCATIVRELEIEHPAARMLSLASERQEGECGDGTNLAVTFAGELLGASEGLIRMGLHTSEIVGGYRAAAQYMMEEALPACVCGALADAGDRAALLRIVRPVLAGKQYGMEEILAPLVVDACMGTMEPAKHGGAPSFSVDDVRVCKIMGGSPSKSCVVRGMVFLRDAETSIKRKGEDAGDAEVKVVVFGCGVEASGTEAKGTVLMKDANDLLSYNRSEEEKMDDIIKSIADSGADVVVSGGTVSEMALHFIERYGMMCVKISSKWELRRLCRATGASALVRLGPPTAEETGACRSVRVREIGGRHCTVFDVAAPEAAGGRSRVSTVLLRASTQSVLNDLERAVDDGANAVRTACCVDGRLVPGAGATEMATAMRIKGFGDRCPGLDQYAIRAFGKALEVVPKILAQNSGQDATNVLAALGAAHALEKHHTGVDISGESEGGVFDAAAADIVDLYGTKESALRLAVDAAITVLRVDQIIMAKPAGAGMQKDARQMI